MTSSVAAKLSGPGLAARDGATGIPLRLWLTPPPIVGLLMDQTVVGQT
jgi:hypothetical protein